MTIQVPEHLEGALKANALARGLEPDSYALEVLEREMEQTSGAAQIVPLESGLGMWSKFGISLSKEEIDENRRDMFRGFGEGHE